MDYQKIKTQVVDGIGVITLSDPSTLNAAGIDLMEELSHACAVFAVGLGRARPHPHG